LPPHLQEFVLSLACPPERDETIGKMVAVHFEAQKGKPPTTRGPKGFDLIGSFV